MTILRPVLWLVVVVAGVLVAAASIIAGEGVDAVAFVVAQVAAFGGAGAFLIGRLPRNPIGWLLGWYGLNFSLGYSADQIARWAFAGGDHDLAAWLWWFESWSFLLGLPLVLALLPLWFPDGRPPAHRWRWVVATATSGAAVAVIGQATRPDAMLVDLGNPLGQPLPPTVSRAMFAVGAGLLLVAILGGVGALVSRFRRCDGQERQQIRWLLTAVTFAVTVFVVLAPVAVVVDTPTASDAVLVGITTGMMALPISVAVAVLHYRLYDLDRIISRTVSWAVISGVLAAVYVLGVSLLSDLLPVEGDLAVAASTLVVAALFNPLRRLVQTHVDRRFNRSRYDAAEVADRFARRLRDEVDLDDLATDLQGVIAAAVQPTHLSVWLRRQPGGAQP